MKKKWILPFILILAFSVTACTIDEGGTKDKEDTEDAQDKEDSSNVEDETPNSDTTNEGNNNVVAYEDIKLTPMDAFDSYMEKYPDTKVEKLELDKDFGSYLYKVEGYSEENEYEIEINPITGDIVEKDTDLDVNLDEKREITKDHVEKVQDIIDKALNDVGEEAKIDNWTLEVDNGRVIVEVDIEKQGIGDVEYVYDIEGNLLERD